MQAALQTVDGAQRQGSTRFPARKPDCVVCGVPTKESLAPVNDNRLGVPGDYSVRRCTGCGLEQIDPRPPADHLKKLYEAYYNFGGEQETTYARLREAFFASWFYRLWLALDGDGSFHARRGCGRLLDIGCNEGRGLRIYERNGFKPEGLELNSRAAQTARAAGFIVQEALLHDFHPPSQYDVAVLSNVLEHSLDPKGMLLDVRRILKPGGQVWISCPNNQSWLRKLFGRAWINWHVPFHIVHFSPRTLQQLLEQTGFAKIRLCQITPALWVACSVITRIFARPGMPTRQLRNALIVFPLMCVARAVLFPLLYLGNRLGRGDCIVAVAEAADNSGTLSAKQSRQDN